MPLRGHPAIRFAWRALAGVLVALCTVPRTAQAETRRFALLVGHNVGSAADAPLRYAESDAQRFAAVLSELGGFRPADIELLSGPGVAGFQAALRRMDARLAAVADTPDAPRTLLVFFYSGHATADALQLGKETVALREVQQWLRNARATVRLGVFDACNSGAVIRAKGGQRGAAFPLDLTNEIETSGYALLTSSSAGEASQESDELRGSFFTHYVLSGLRGGADFSSDGQVTLSELYHYAYNETVLRSAGSFAGIQHPHFDFELSGRGDLVLARLGRSAAFLDLGAGPGGTYLVFRASDGRMLAEVLKPHGQSRRLALPVGQYTVFRRAADGLAVGQLRLAAGQTAALQPSAMRPVDLDRYALKGGQLVRRPHLSVGPAFGVSAVLDARVRREILTPLALWGVSAHFEDVFVEHLDVALDLLAGLSREPVTIDGQRAGQDLLALTAGLAVLWRFDLPARFTVHLGPQLALRVLRRALDEPGSAEPHQWVVTATPAAVARLGWHWRWLSLGLEPRVGYMGFRYSGAGMRHMAFCEALLGLEFRWGR